jgi:glutamate formiminotransferase
MSTLVECVPNFSEGRDKAKVDAIVDAMKMDGVYLLDREMDADHNRCVITLVGEREAIQEAAIRGVGKAAELIDLNVHKGAHPRMGAADVVPFIPIDGVTLEDCVTMARHVGEEIWKRFQIPVYLYEAAAQRRSGRIWRTSGADSLRGYGRRSRRMRRESRILARRECIRRRARRWWERGSF